MVEHGLLLVYIFKGERRENKTVLVLGVYMPVPVPASRKEPSTLRAPVFFSFALFSYLIIGFESDSRSNSSYSTRFSH
jgi:hypothetical protein